MIKLSNNYQIESDKNAFTLVRLTGKKDKEGNPIKDIKGYYTTFTSALDSYKEQRIMDKVSDEDIDLKQVYELLKEIRKEIKAYD